MGLFFWGLAWFAMSVFIFGLGRYFPSLRPKPPLVISRPRSRSPRLSPTSLTPPPPPASKEKPLPTEPDDVSCKSAASDNQGATTSDPSSSTPPSCKSRRWSFSARYKNTRMTPSPKSSILSAGSSTLVGSPSPPCDLPELPMLDEKSPMFDRTYDKHTASPDDSSSGSSYTSRNVRLSSIRMFKTFSRKMSSRQKSESISSVATSSTTNAPSENTEEKIVVDQSSEYVREDERSRPALPGHQRNNSVPAELFTTTFMNPFRNKLRKPKASSAAFTHSSAPPSPTPSPRRSFTPRRVLTSFHLSLSANDQHSVVLDSPRSSTSSASTSYIPPIDIAQSGAFGSPRGTPRTQPYGPPYYAAMPTSSPRTPSNPKFRSSRRATSLTLERPATVAEESGEEDLNALGLELGQTRPLEVQTAPHRRRPRHWATASDGGTLPIAGSGSLRLSRM